MSFINDISEYIRSGECTDQNLGLEIEHFIINDEGTQMEFHEISSLIYMVGKRLGADIIYMDGYPVGYYTGEYSTSLEPACQFEISINPYSDLDVIKNIYDDCIKTKKIIDDYTKANSTKLKYLYYSSGEKELRPLDKNEKENIRINKLGYNLFWNINK